MQEVSKTTGNVISRGPGGSAAARLVEASAAAGIEDRSLLEALRNRDEAAFTSLVQRYNTCLLRLAMLYVPSRAVAEEVVQETWLGVLQGIDRFEGRSSLKTWLFSILTNQAKTRGGREGRSIPFSALGNPGNDSREGAVDPERFLEASHPQWPAHWASPPESWSRTPEENLLSRETRSNLERAVAALPPAQREVITLRDIEQWSSEEVCNALGLSETNQRVLLHRARSRVRRSVEEYYQQHGSSGRNELQRTCRSGYRLPGRCAVSF
jgi:RNA polymerase sigma-70 factor, ECF subfamily